MDGGHIGEVQYLRGRTVTVANILNDACEIFACI